MWDKTQRDPDRRRRGADRRPRLSSVTSATSKEREAAAGAFSNNPSPSNDGGGQTENHEAEVNPRLPAMKRSRALSEDIISPRAKGRPLDQASAAVALQRAIKSSPHKFVGTHQVPIEVADDLTPQPTRRILFPSPAKSEEAKSKRNSLSGSIGEPRKSSSKPSETTEDNSAQADKENQPPAADEDVDMLDGDASMPHARPTTPTRSSTAGAHLLKTPTRSPKALELPPTTGDFFSSAAKALLRPVLTPKRTPTRQHSQIDHHSLVELTPFTAHLNQLLSEPGPVTNSTHDHHTSHNGHSPGSNHTFDFPPLPSLHNTPNRSRILDFDFSAFDSQDLISTDVAMPSSPPAWFGVYEDPDADDDNVGGLWGGGDETLPSMLHSSPMKEQEQQQTYLRCESAEKSVNPKSLGGLIVDEDGTARVEFGGLS